MQKHYTAIQYWCWRSNRSNSEMTDDGRIMAFRYQQLLPSTDDHAGKHSDSSLLFFTLNRKTISKVAVILILNRKQIRKAIQSISAGCSACAFAWRRSRACCADSWIRILFKCVWGIMNNILQMHFPSFLKTIFLWQKVTW